MRSSFLFALGALAFGGCLFPQPTSAGVPLMRAEAFDSASAPWVVELSGGCGMCPGWRGFENASESYVLVVFLNGRVLRADTNGGWGDGSGLHLAPGITFDAEELAKALVASDRARGETWVHRVLTARLADEAEPARLASEWRADATGPVCMDTGFDVAFRHASGTIDHETFSCPPESGSMAAFTARLFELARAMPGNSTRTGLPGAPAYG